MKNQQILIFFWYITSWRNWTSENNKSVYFTCEVYLLYLANCKKLLFNNVIKTYVQLANLAPNKTDSNAAW